MPGHHTGDVGFNPFRESTNSLVDYVVVVAAMAVIVGLVLWAILG